MKIICSEATSFTPLPRSATVHYTSSLLRKVIPGEFKMRRTQYGNLSELLGLSKTPFDVGKMQI
jgi:hypothetical protein